MFWLNLQHVWVRRTENLQWHIIPKCLSTLLFLCLFWQEKCPISSNSLFCKANVRLLLSVCWITMEACFVCCVPQKLVLTIQRQSILLQAKFSDTSPQNNPKQNKAPMVPLWCGVHHSTVWVSHNAQLMRDRQNSKDNLGVSTKMLCECKLCLYRDAMPIHFKQIYEHFLSVLSLIAEMCPADARHTRVYAHTQRGRGRLPTIRLV